MQVIFTKHAKERMLSRNMVGKDIENTILNYDKKTENRERLWGFRKKIGTYQYKVIAKADADKWIVISTWVDPPLPGSFDLVKKERYNRYLKAGTWGRIWMQIRRAIFNWEF